VLTRVLSTVRLLAASLRDMADNGAADTQHLGLADALESLRSELETALDKGKDQTVQFEVSDVTLTLQTVARKARGGHAGIRWYVVSAGAGASAENATVQTLVLNLTPLTAAEPGGVPSAGAVPADSAAVTDDEAPGLLSELLAGGGVQLAATGNRGFIIPVRVPGQMKLPPDPRYRKLILEGIGGNPLLDAGLHDGLHTGIKDAMRAQMPGIADFWQDSPSGD
jgi:hypothetical protein